MNSVQVQDNANTYNNKVNKLVSDKTVNSFMEIFRGRDDACGRLSKDEKKAWCNDTPVTRKQYLKHLTGSNYIHSLGIYPLTNDNTVYFAAIDVDIHDGKDKAQLAADASKVKEWLAGYGIKAYIEISKGKGFHIWVFFSEPVAALEARRLLRTAWREAIGGSIPEIFPRQDTVDNMSYGNMINLPYFLPHAKENRRVIWEDGYYLTLEKFIQIVKRHTAAEINSVLEKLPPEPRNVKPFTKTKTKTHENGVRDILPCASAAMKNGADVGTRRPTLFRLAAHFNKYGYPYDVALALIKTVDEKNKPSILDEFGEKELEHHVNSVYNGRGGNSYTSYGCNEDTWVSRFCPGADQCPVHSIKAREELLKEKEQQEEIVIRPIDDVQQFPLQALPECLIPLVKEGAEANCCPPDFIAVPLLTTVGSAIGNSRVLEIKKGWQFKANMYSCIIATPGSAKSPAQDLVTKPVKEKQKEYEIMYDMDLEKYKNDFRQWEFDCENAKKGKRVKPEKPEEPTMKEIYTTDSTIEALAQLMENNPRGMYIILDELTAWVNGLNQYKGGRGSDREHYLSFWGGANTKVNRVRKKPIILDNPFLSVNGCIPPAVLNNLIDERGNGEDGFIHRILFSFPESISQRWSDSEISNETLRKYHELYYKLLQSKSDVPVVVKLSQDAYGLWVKCFNENAEERDALDFPENLQGVWAKMPSQAARLALIIHTCRYISGETNSGDVDISSIASAWTLVDYFKNHARKVYKQLKEDPEDKTVRKILEWCKKHKKEEVTTRELMQAKLFKTSEEATLHLRKMQQRSLGVLEERGQGRGRKKTVFVLN